MFLHVPKQLCSKPQQRLSCWRWPMSFLTDILCAWKYRGQCSGLKLMLFQTPHISSVTQTVTAQHLSARFGLFFKTYCHLLVYNITAFSWDYIKRLCCIRPAKCISFKVHVMFFYLKYGKTETDASFMKFTNVRVFFYLCTILRLNYMFRTLCWRGHT